MSEAAKPKGNPVRPPIANIGRKAIAKSIGVLKRIDAPQRLRTNAVRITTDGIDIIIVVI